MNTQSDNSMEALERDIAAWYVREYPDLALVLDDQFRKSIVVEREFTSGGGVFVSFEVPEGVKVFPLELAAKLKGVQLEGPKIDSSILECGAIAGLGFSDNGTVIDYFEIWSLASDYPLNKHVSEYVFSEASINYIDDL